jgi:hypothetical protein
MNVKNTVKTTITSVYISTVLLDCTSPFSVYVRTDAVTDVAANANTMNLFYSRGKCLELFHQVC